MNSFKRVRAFQIELEFGSVGFWGEGKTGLTGEKPLGARERTNIKLNPHMASTPGFEPGPHWREASALTTAPPLYLSDIRRLISAVWYQTSNHRCLISDMCCLMSGCVVRRLTTESEIGKLTSDVWYETHSIYIGIASMCEWRLLFITIWSFK